ncbi:MAG: ABC transporter permease [Nocardioidaceae bacterium]|nr:ABC transporter permease [Nocardioidaceae bacterium]
MALAPAPLAVDNCLTRNEWICGEYLLTRRTELADATMQHLGIVLASVVLGLVIALPLAWLSRRYPRLEAILLGSTTAIYTIPSLALFSLLVPLSGLTVQTVVLGLGLYSLTILVRAILDGLRAVPPEVVESARGVGHSDGALLLKVQVPLALPTVMAGLRVAVVSAVALTTVGAILDAGGLGGMLLDGQRTNFKAQVLATSVLCVLLALVLDLLLVLVERMLTPWLRRTEVVR